MSCCIGIGCRVGDDVMHHIKGAVSHEAQVLGIKYGAKLAELVAFGVIQVLICESFAELLV